MEEAIKSIVDMITGHWEVFKYVFYGLGIKFIGEGVFNISKFFVAIFMGWKELKGK